MKIKIKDIYIHLDKEDYNIFLSHKWTKVNKYIACFIKEKQSYKTVYLHRFLMNPKVGEEIDHIDGNPYNNTRSNLRIVTRCQNMYNTKLYVNSTTNKKGVSFQKDIKKYTAKISHKGKRLFIGTFSTIEEASKAYEKKAKDLHGNYARMI